jgi:hypothetical protein
MMKIIKQAHVYVRLRTLCMGDHVRMCKCRMYTCMHKRLSQSSKSTCAAGILIFCIYTHIIIRIRTHSLVRNYIHMHTYIHTYMHTYIYIYAYMHTYMPGRSGYPGRRRLDTYMATMVYVYTYVHTYSVQLNGTRPSYHASVWVCVCMYMYTYTYLHTCMRAWKPGRSDCPWTKTIENWYGKNRWTAICRACGMYVCLCVFFTFVLRYELVCMYIFVFVLCVLKGDVARSDQLYQLWGWSMYACVYVCSCCMCMHRRMHVRWYIHRYT